MRAIDAQVSELLDAALKSTEQSAILRVSPNGLRLDAAPIDRATGVLDRPVVSDGSFAKNKLAQETLNSMGDAVITMDVVGNVTYLNPVAENLTGWPRADALGRPVTDVLRIVQGNTREAVRNPMVLAVENDKTSMTTAHWVLVRRDGSEFAIQDSAAPIHDRSGQVIGAVMVFRDVSVSRAIALKIAYLAHHDMLTGLPNRMLLFDRLEQAIRLTDRHHEKFALLFVDMDGFKRINDSFGHPTGDQFLVAIAKRLRNCVRGTDTVSRFGGDEFVVLLTEISHSSDAVLCATKIRNELSKQYHFEHHRRRLAASIGVGIYPNDGRDAESLLRNADSGMLDAKRSGGDRIQLCTPTDTFHAAAKQTTSADTKRRRFGTRRK